MNGIGELLQVASKRQIKSDSLPGPVREASIKALESVGRRATAGDIASRAGLKLSEAEKTLNILAADAEGYLEVEKHNFLFSLTENFFFLTSLTGLYRWRYNVCLSKGH